MLRIAFAGTPEFALPALDALAAVPGQVVGVLTQPDRPKGRGRGLKPSPIKQRALELHLPLAQPARLASAEELEPLRRWQPDVLVVVAYGLILPPAALALPRLGCLNIHASLLPRWRGAAPIHRAILAGDRDSGVSIMQLDAGLDTGPVLAQRSVPITAETTTAELHAVLARLGAEQLVAVLAAVEDGTARVQPQSTSGVSYAAKIDKREARIDWSRSAVQIARQVRGCNPWPVAETQMNGTQVRIWQAAALTQMPLCAATARAAQHGGHTSAAPGTILGLANVGQTSERICVACGVGVLAIAQLQSAGRRALGAEEFANGHTLKGLAFQ